MARLQKRMGAMYYTWPEHIVYLLLLVPLAVILGYGVMREIHAREALVSPIMAGAMMPRMQLMVLLLKKIMIFCGIALLLFALLGPRFCVGGKPVLRKGVDVVFLLDVSRSMSARDVLPDRLGQAQYEITQISRAVSGGRRAILLFAASPLVQCPLTTDQEGFEALLGMATPALIEQQGTAFSSAFELAGTLFDSSSPVGAKKGINGEKIIVLLSDGEDHAGGFQAAASKLKKAGIHLFVIGVGMNQPVVIPLGEGAGEGIKRDAAGRAVTTSFRGQTLQMLAREAGGAYFRSSAQRPVYSEVSERINSIEVASRWVMEPVEREPLTRYFLAAGLFLLLAETLIVRSGARWG